MRNKAVLLTILPVLMFLIFGCSYYNRLEGSNTNSSINDNRTLSEKTIDSTVGNEKIGVPECDEIIDFFTEQAKSTDEDFVTKAARQFALNKIRESFRESIEQNKGDKKALAKECREFKIQLDKFKKEDKEVKAK